MSSSPVVMLDELLAGIVAAPALPVRDLKLDTRQLEPGDGFVAVAGGARHGLDFLPQALAKGARLVLWEPVPGRTLPALADGCTAIAVPGLRAQLGTIADRLHGSPSARLAVAGVTGTNGKTTCAWLAAQAVARLGGVGGYTGTLGVGVPPDVRTSTHTTGDVLTVHRQLASLVASGATHVAMEVSSHALDQGRIDGVRVEIAAFTNLTRDHLDYHRTFEAYAAAKERLFHRHELRHAIVNCEDPVGRGYAAQLEPSVALTAIALQPTTPLPAAARTLRVLGSQAGAAGLELTLDDDGVEVLLATRLVAGFNVENVTVVYGVLRAWGHTPDECARALGTVAAPPGRLETVRGADGVLAIIDYAHTPDALAKALAAARTHCRGRLTVVFGCGGDRDPGKRPQMGAIAAELADRVIVTDDNPRTEDGDAIVAQIIAGLASPERAIVERDRRAAIGLALAGAVPGDVVLVAGKGHEEYQVVGSEVLPFSDRQVVGELLREAA